ncbi:putative siderophore biosynthesis protein [Tilletiaria anomala UBC 951]|uniref:Putative siderophore biosynthesis protein n=1 Tax=Tilletiaria anomala (strain ATCC 24038 / CBS 436.72 / UBC 951) TaxID=1037660 RepID=A0A066VTL4_TILAU|nr:putative siderophore biosynthesis protein [Tilletiaria anomala UBC 951]KDN41880.1 putative siderophore biosynthesis protein [Tilletiaria anomala UBC 951]
MPSGTLRNAGIKPVPGSIVYRRYIPEVAQHLSYRMVSIGSPEAGEGARDGPAYSRDVQLCAKWQNSDRVHAGWRQRDPAMSAHFDCIKEIVDDPARFGLIGYWDDEPWGFVEIYFAKESNVAPFYQVADRDMGFHALVGEAKYRGAHRVRTWMGAAVHLCFLLDPQTQLVVSEPRASNTKMVEYECMVGGHVEKLIDLGHKRSALVMIPRERFFQLCPMGPLPQQMEAAKAWEG